MHIGAFVTSTNLTGSKNDTGIPGIGIGIGGRLQKHIGLNVEELSTFPSPVPVTRLSSFLL